MVDYLREKPEAEAGGAPSVDKTEFRIELFRDAGIHAIRDLRIGNAAFQRENVRIAIRPDRFADPHTVIARRKLRIPLSAQLDVLRRQLLPRRAKFFFTTGMNAPAVDDDEHAARLPLTGPRSDGGCWRVIRIPAGFRMERI